MTTNWYFSDGTPVGTTDRNVRQASYPNGTTILQIANGRALDYCDAGVYTCQAVSSTGEAQERDFKLLVDCKCDHSACYSRRVQYYFVSSSLISSWYHSVFC